MTLESEKRGSARYVLRTSPSVIAAVIAADGLAQPRYLLSRFGKTICGPPEFKLFEWSFPQTGSVGVHLFPALSHLKMKVLVPWFATPIRTSTACFSNRLTRRLNFDLIARLWSRRIPLSACSTPFTHARTSLPSKHQTLRTLFSMKVPCLISVRVTND